MSQSRLSLSPIKFRAILIGLMVLVLSLGVFGFYTAQAALSSYSEEVSTKVAEAEASKDSIERLKRLQTELENLKEVRERANSIAAESQLYRYQNQIIADINRYANQSGVSVSRFDFQADSSSSSTASSSRSGSSAQARPSPSGGGLSSTTVNITLDSPVNYTNLLRFIRTIEQNLTKMQISGVSLSPGGDSNTVSTDSLNIEVYIK